MKMLKEVVQAHDARAVLSKAVSKIESRLCCEVDPWFDDQMQEIVVQPMCEMIYALDDLIEQAENGGPPENDPATFTPTGDGTHWYIAMADFAWGRGRSPEEALHSMREISKSDKYLIKKCPRGTEQCWVDDYGRMIAKPKEGEDLEGGFELVFKNFM